MHMLLTNLEELRVEKQASCGGKPWRCEDFKVKVIYIYIYIYILKLL